MKISIKKFIQDKFLDLNFNSYVLIIDISKNIFIENIKFLFLELLYPLYINNKKLRIENDFGLFSSNYISINYKFIHENIKMLDTYLYLEAWYNLFNIIDDEKEKTYKELYKLENLNEFQEKAVKHINGPFRLLAPAGSGKTKTLINRILNLINNGINEKNILALAFNKKAEVEMTERLKKFGINNLEVRTFHSFGNQLLRDNYDLEFGSDDTEFINKSILEEILFNKKIDIKFVDRYLELFSKFKNELTNKEDMILKNKNLYDIFISYIDKLIEEKIYGFDDMIYLTLKLILENGNLRSRLQGKYQYILVDEAQDLNDSQLLLIKILSLPQNNLFIVGDDDQTIYGFRGANVNGLLNFENNYSCCVTETLKINYRSMSDIVIRSKKFIDNNKKRIYKEIIPFKKDKGNIDLFIGKNIMDECQKIVDWVKKEQAKGISNNEIAILYRYHEYEYLLKVYFLINKIPIASKDNCFKIFEDVLPFLNFVFGKASFQDYKKILNIRKFYIGDNELKKISNDKKFLKYLKQKNLYFLAFKLGIYKRILKKNNINFKHFILTFNLDKYLLEKFDNLNKNILDNIIDALGYYGKIKKIYELFIKSNEEFMENDDDNIVLSTIHKVKGNEFESVCYYHLVTPECNIEDERKVSYVAFTRAKSNLLITTVKNDKLMFINEYFDNIKN